ncbi:hypothetical protein QL285_039513 [Trifolium repens]|nr:hypothetical protein QL285_039513 [Trifolium repens]
MCCKYVINLDKTKKNAQNAPSATAASQQVPNATAASQEATNATSVSQQVPNATAACQEASNATHAPQQAPFDDDDDAHFEMLAAELAAAFEATQPTVLSQDANAPATTVVTNNGVSASTSSTKRKHQAIAKKVGTVASASVTETKTGVGPSKLVKPKKKGKNKDDTEAALVKPPVEVIVAAVSDTIAPIQSTITALIQAEHVVKKAKTTHPTSFSQPTTKATQPSKPGSSQPQMKKKSPEALKKLDFAKLNDPKVGKCLTKLRNLK